MTFSQQLRFVWAFHLTASTSGSQHVGLHFHGICHLFVGFTSHSPPGNRGVPCWPCDIGPPNWLDIFASPIRAELCTIIVSYLYDQREDFDFASGYLET